MLKVALVVAEGSGRRISAIRMLRWDDVDFRGLTMARGEPLLRRRQGRVWIAEVTEPVGAFTRRQKGTCPQARCLVECRGVVASPNGLSPSAAALSNRFSRPAASS